MVVIRLFFFSVEFNTRKVCRVDNVIALFPILLRNALRRFRTVRRNAADEDPWNMGAYELIKMYADELDIPVVYRFPSGHSRPNYAQYLGRKVRVVANEEGASIEFL